MYRKQSHQTKTSQNVYQLAIRISPSRSADKGRIGTLTPAFKLSNDVKVNISISFSDGLCP